MVSHPLFLIYYPKIKKIINRSNFEEFFLERGKICNVISLLYIYLVAEPLNAGENSVQKKHNA